MKKRNSLRVWGPCLSLKFVFCKVHAFGLWLPGACQVNHKAYVVKGMSARAVYHALSGFGLVQKPEFAAAWQAGITPPERKQNSASGG